MLSKPRGWNFTIKSMASQLKEGKESIGSALNELKKAGYVSYQKLSNGTGTYRLLVDPKPGNPDLGFPMVGKPGRISNKDLLVRKIEEEGKKFQDLFSLYRLHTKNAGKKSEALKAYRETKIPEGITIEDIAMAALFYLNDPWVPVDEQGEKVVYSLANFLRNEIYLNYIPHRLQIDLDDKKITGEYDRQNGILHGDDGMDYRLSTSRLAELLSKKKLRFVFGATP